MKQKKHRKRKLIRYAAVGLAAYCAIKSLAKTREAQAEKEEREAAGSG